MRRLPTDCPLKRPRPASRREVAAVRAATAAGQRPWVLVSVGGSGDSLYVEADQRQKKP